MDEEESSTSTLSQDTQAQIDAIAETEEDRAKWTRALHTYEYVTYTDELVPGKYIRWIGVGEREGPSPWSSYASSTSSISDSSSVPSGSSFSNEGHPVLTRGAIFCRLNDEKNLIVYRNMHSTFHYTLDITKVDAIFQKMSPDEILMRELLH